MCPSAACVILHFLQALCFGQILKNDYKELPGLDSSSDKDEKRQSGDGTEPTLKFLGHRDAAEKAMRMKEAILQLLSSGTRLRYVRVPLHSAPNVPDQLVKQLRGCLGR